MLKKGGLEQGMSDGFAGKQILYVAGFLLCVLGKMRYNERKGNEKGAKQRERFRKFKTL
jgi:hypothetical protein